MDFTDREKWWMNLAMVWVMCAATNSPWKETFGSILGAWMAGGLSGGVIVLNFLVNGVRPPNLTGGKTGA